MTLTAEAVASFHATTGNPPFIRGWFDAEDYARQAEGKPL